MGNLILTARQDNTIMITHVPSGDTMQIEFIYSMGQKQGRIAFRAGPEFKIGRRERDDVEHHKGS